MQLHVPNSAFIGNIDSFLKSFDRKDRNSLEITFNKKWVSVHPVVLSMIAALGLTIPNKSAIKCENLEAKSRPYFERMGLFRVLGIDSTISIVEHEHSGRFVPLTRVTSSGELSAFIKDMVPLLHAAPEQAEPIRYIISELVRNVLEHSGSDKGAIICAQFYKKSNRISIGVADYGVGIKKTIEVAHHAPDDLDAIRLALMPGITGATRRLGGTETNAGAGLFFIKSIAKVNGDFFMIYSGSAMYKLLKKQKQKTELNPDPFKDNCSKKNDFPHWNGTAVGIDISLDRHQDFDRLLDLIREVYRKEIRERKRESFREVRFV